MTMLGSLCDWRGTTEREFEDREQMRLQLHQWAGPLAGVLAQHQPMVREIARQMCGAGAGGVGDGQLPGFTFAGQSGNAFGLDFAQLFALPPIFRQERSERGGVNQDVVY